MQVLEKLKPVALLLLRCSLGIILIHRGYPKLFGQTANAMQYFAHLGLPSYFVYVAGVLEVFGGCLLIVGLFTRVVGLLLAIEMGVAIWKVHLAKGYLAIGEYQFHLVLAAAAFTLATVGAGAISLDRPIFRARARAQGES